MPFSRNADDLLLSWLERSTRKPLFLRGARQTGKTTAVRNLAPKVPCYLELNLERREDLDLIKTCKSARELLERMQQHHNLKSLPRDTLLFLDEIQEHPEALNWLRFFYEDHPEIAVVTAGSLLEVRLKGEAFSFPVGRVEFLRLEPLTFLEFLRATSGDRLASDLESSFDADSGVDPGIHHLAMERFRQFLIVGGLPEAIETWRTTQNLVEVKRVHDSLRQAYAEDLLKYGVRNGTHHLELVLTNAPAYFGARFKVRHLGAGEKDIPVTRALELLEHAMVLHRANPTSARTLPLVARRRAAHKLLPLDIGLGLAQLDVRPEHLAERSFESMFGGRMAEAFVGVQLLAAHPEQPRSLSFWTREGVGSSNAEVDFLVPTRSGVLPVEVKSGAAGSLKSLHRFLAGTDVDQGIRLLAARGAVEDLSVKVGEERPMQYRLHSIPMYLAELLPTM